MFKDYYISIRLFIDTPQLLHKSQTSLLTWLPIEYYNKTNVLPNIMNFGVYF